MLKIIKNAHLTFIETGSKLLLNNLTHLSFQHQLTKISKKQAKNNIKLCFENRPKAHQKSKNISKITKTKNNLKLCFDKWLKHSKIQKQFKNYALING